MSTQQTGADTRARVLRLGIVPGVATVVMMTVAFGIVVGLTLAFESLIVGTVIGRGLGLVSVFVLPQFIVGVWAGLRHGLSVWPPVAAGVAPVVAAVVTFGAWGGPLLAPVSNPVLLVGAVLAWMLVAGVGLVGGDRLLS